VSKSRSRRSAPRFKRPDRQPFVSLSMAIATAVDLSNTLCACGHFDTEHVGHGEECHGEDATCPCEKFVGKFWRFTVTQRRP
jgi:hypothetical protein